MTRTCKMAKLQILFNFVVRVMFTGHVFLCIWTMVNVHQESRYWYNLLVFGALQCAEGWVTFKASKSGGWKWFCPSVCLFILNAVPYLWMLEVHLLSKRQRIDNHTIQCDPERQDNVTLRMYPLKVSIPELMPLSEWALMLEYTLLLLLIVGRWLLPKGEISRDQHSQLLLVFIGIASDILEFITEGIRTDEITCNFTMVIIILAIWAWSLIQFALTLTLRDVKENTGSRKRERWYALCCGSEIWAIFVTIFVQDGPYFAVRLYIMIQYNVTNQLMLFFTTKNALVLILQIYRVTVVCINHRKVILPSDEEFGEEIKSESRPPTPSPYPSPYQSPFPSPYHKPSTGLNNEVIIPVSIVGTGSLMDNENGSVWLEPNRDLKKSNLEKWPAILNIDTMSHNNLDGYELRDRSNLINHTTPTGSVRSLQAYDNPAFNNLRSGSF